MTTFDDRERGYEAKFANDEALEFRAQARRDRALALWAGERMGLTAAELEDYVTAVWREDLREPGDQDVYAKVLADLEAKGTGIDGAELRARMDALLNQAREELRKAG